MNHELDEYCPCCGYDSLDPSSRLQYSICEIGFWEDDPVQFEDPDFVSGANRVSLNQARENFARLGSCEEDMVRNCRKPTIKDRRKPNWISLQNR